MTSEHANEWDARAYDSSHSFIYEAATDLVNRLDPSPNELVLDLGCGTGQLTRSIADRGATVVGTDSALEMVLRAREAHPELSFVRADARAIPFSRSFDAVFSNAVLHWIDVADQDETLSEVRRVLAPGGRFVAELGGSGNVARVLKGVQRALNDRDIVVESPWYFPSVGEYATLLEQQGFEVCSIRLFDRPTQLDGGDDGLRNWLELFGDKYFADLTPDECETIFEDIEDRLRDELYEDGVWTLDYRRLQFIAIAVPDDDG